MRPNSRARGGAAADLVRYKRARESPNFIRAASATRAGAGGLAELGAVAATRDAARRAPSRFKMTSSSEAPKAHLGVTPPINTDMPAEHDAAASEALVHTLRELGVYESDAGKAVRTGVLDRLRAIADAWCENEWALAIAERACDGADCERALAASAPPRCELRTFGSVRLDVHTPDADIDVVLVAPRHCTRRAFFDTLVAALESDAHIGAGGVMAVRDAYTPVVKLRVGSTDVDLLFAPLACDELPEPLDVMDDAVLEGLDEAAIRSLNGARVAEMLLSLVPDPAVFRVALRAVKRWARCKGLYSNVLGLLGGVNCAILAAFVCQRYPNAAPSTVVGRFFRIFDGWDWPNPVLIAAPGAPPSSAGDESVASRYAAWNPRLNPRDRAHLAPIVTPAHPTMNSSYNVGAPQLRAIKDELSKGLETTRRAEKLAAHWRADESPTGDRAADLRDAWRRLFAPSDFFAQHRHYVQVDVSAADDAGLRKWNAWCESRLRNLVVALDTPGYVRARPHATHVEREIAVTDDAGEATGATKKTRSYFVALSFETHVQHIDLTPCVREFSNRVNNWEHRSSDMDLELRHTPKDALPPEALPPGSSPGVPDGDNDGGEGDVDAEEDLYLHEVDDVDDDDDGPRAAARPRDGDASDGGDAASAPTLDDEGSASLSPKKPRADSSDMVDVDGDGGPPPPAAPLSWAAVAKRSAEPKPKRMCPS